MKTETTTTGQTAGIIAEEISQRLVDMNYDLYIAESEENYEQAALISTALKLFITNSSFQLAEITNGKQKEIYFGLLANSNFIFQSIKENENNINNL